ncbi:bifunctional DNA primase/polymerase [Corynebacterium senegalense]|uniref:bifunctional DNA primase/polymerase n=1 Tax=Corynebacterium senegalense TaxID=2080750 RepID=UPI0015F279F2|nr:bifunctional DNA primase/polymerase [Corynebacterium senegalense]
MTDLLRTAPRVDRATRDEVLAYAAALQGHGLALIPIERGGKKPATPNGLNNATTEPGVFSSHYRDGMNLAVVLGPSKLVIVDADTPAEVDGWHTWQAQNGTNMPTPTVHSPGTTRGHHSGGHWWIDAADTNDALAEVKVGGATAMAGNRYVLLPGSVRDDAADPAKPAYVVADGGRVYTARAARPVIDAARDRARTRAEAAEKRDHAKAGRADSFATSNIDTWAEETDWHDLLAPAGWFITGTDNCGCDIYQAPGCHSSTKSATAHNGMCGYADNGGALQLWTSNPPDELKGYERVSKFQFVALTQHGGDYAAARTALGIADDIVGACDLSEVEVDPDAPNPFTHTAATTRPRDLTRAIDTGDDSELWEATKWLAEVKRWAWIKHVDPYAMLLVVLSEVALRVDPRVVMANPADASLNLITMLVTPPSGGKGTTTKTARKLVTSAMRTEWEIHEGPGFSGQGLGSSFAWRSKTAKPDGWVPPRMRFVESEVASLTALASAKNSTHVPTLNKFFMGEAMGATNSDVKTSWHVPEHTYRGVLNIEAQEETAAPLLTGDVKGTGFTARLLVAVPELTTAGRKLWREQRDAGAFDTNDEPTPVIRVAEPQPPMLTMQTTNRRLAFPTAPEVIRAIEDANLRLNEGDEQAAHEGLRRRKVATLMAIASGEWELTPRWWHLAGYVMANHRAVITQWHEKYARQARDRKVEAATAELAVKAEAAEKLLHQRVDTAAKWLSKHAGGEGVRFSELKRNGPAKRWDSDTLEAVREVLEGDPQFEVFEQNKGWRVIFTG